MTTPEKQLKKMRKASKPETTFKKELWSELNVAFDKEYPAMRISWTRLVAVPMAALVLFVTMGTGVYAYSSPEVNEQSALYPVKRGIESVEERFRRSPKARALFHARMAERRIAEGESLLRSGHLSKQQLIEIAEQLGYTLEDLNEAKANPELRQEIKADLEEEILERIKAQSARYRHLIERARELKQQNPDAPVINGEIRNKIQEIRVHIDESSLDTEQKESLIDGLGDDASLNTDQEEPLIDASGGETSSIHNSIQ